ncbi:hypothetical protein JOD63_000384 [Microbacterium terrae]|uniref:Sulfate permease n=1 Tax=Microbacterium terrae TaxID=69369 RepID=A0A0M2H2A6_9MICO|nr:sulfate permease [Microbacterium terrae]KJL37584.1 hypothetical protein RS81_03341 [Microbacterium terrae]MBP1076416.1 hypothetical protein [Microbacterium terrae]GLJ97244.1 hypothetical protein GCM10017594_04410 [Microbacterium terrae]
MFGLIWSLSAHIHSFLRRAMPTNLLIAAIMTRRGLKWGAPAMLLAPVYLLGAVVSVGLIGQGAPKWLYLLAFICLWNAIKFVVVGPVTLIRLAYLRMLEARARHVAALPVASDGTEVARVEAERAGATV